MGRIDEILFRFQVLRYWLQFRWNRRKLFDSQKLQSIQQKRRERWSKQLSRSPFYKAFQGKALIDFPILNKDQFMAHFDAINTVGISKKDAMALALKSEQSRDFAPMIKGITIGLSTGTSGNRGLFIASKKERALWVAAILDRVIGFSWKHRKVAFFLRANSNLYTSVQSRWIQFEFFDILIPLEAQFDRFQHLRADILVGQPSVLVELGKLCVKHRVSWRPSKVISVAEVLEPEDEDLLESIFSCKIDQVYQCTEGFLAATCPHGNLHLNEDFLIIEKKFLDDQKTRFHPIITDLFRISQPVVRYELNDILHVGPECPCGRKTQTLKKIEGRSDDTFRFKSKEGKEIIIFPDLLRRAIVRASDQIQSYTIIQKNNQEVHFSLELKDLQRGAEAIIETIRQNLEQLFHQYDLTAVRLIHQNSIPQQKGSKKRRVRNECTTSL